METITATDQRTFIFPKGHTTTLKEFDKVFSELFNRTWVVKGKEYNLSDLGWKRDYNKRKRSLGLCTYKARRNRLTGQAELIAVGTVWISMELLSRNLDKAYDFEDTIRHEIAHAIHTHISGRSSHDWVWKSICREVGADDSRLHEGFLEKPKGKYSAVCPSCKRSVEKYRKPKREQACGKCCKEKNGGRFSREFLLEYVQNY